MKKSIAILLLAAALIPISGCGDEENGGDDASGTGTATTPTATATTPDAPAAPAGIQIDPALQSASGIPEAADMPALINLQAQLPYPVIVPTFVPGGYKLDTMLMGFSSPGEGDPAGYYSFRYYDPGQDILNMTFNQSIANSKPISGYYVTAYEANGQAYEVYWHKTKEYLPAGDPVRTDSVGDAEGFVVVWQGQYNAADGSVQPLYYAITTSTYTGIDWGTMQQIIAGLRPLSAVGG